MEQFRDSRARSSNKSEAYLYLYVPLIAQYCLKSQNIRYIKNTRIHYNGLSVWILRDPEKFSAAGSLSWVLWHYSMNFNVCSSIFWLKIQPKAWGIMLNRQYFFSNTPKSIKIHLPKQFTIYFHVWLIVFVHHKSCLMEM